MRSHTARLFLVAIPFVALASSPRAESPLPALTVVVMDPLSAPLSCPCVQGYAQRDYEKLAAHLEKQLHRPVKVHFSEGLKTALDKKTGGKVDLILGKESVVRAATKNLHLDFAPCAALTDKDGKTTQTGLIVVATKDSALTAGDLKDHRILFGPKECDEKYAAAMTLLRESGITPPAKPECCNACSEGATTVIDLHKSGVKAATVISSYAQPLLEGCGTIKKGDLRVVGETDPVPFIVAFASVKLTSSEREAIQKALLKVGKTPELCKVMETKYGFVAFEQNGKKK